MRRQAVDNRRFYTKEEKEYILSKTGGRCAHCGKKLSTKTMQKDHSIPWSKGGVSDVENIVPLCADCNKEKADRVLNPGDYFFYLKPQYKKSLQDYFDRYMREVSYLTVKDMFPVDSFKANTEVPIVYAGGTKTIYKSGYVQYDRAVYSDLDEIYYYLLAYNEKYSFAGESPRDYIKKLLTEYFEFGCILFSRRRNGEIAVVMLSMFENRLPAISSERDDARIVNLGWGIYIFINPNIKLTGIFSLPENRRIRFNSSVYNTYLYIPSIISAFYGLIRSLDLDNGVFSLAVYMPKNNPTSWYVISSVIEHDWPYPWKEYPVDVCPENSDMLQGVLFNINSKKETTTFASNPRIKEGYVAAGKHLYDLLVGSNLFEKWERRYLPRKHIFLHEYASEMGMSYIEVFNYLVEKDILSFWNCNGENMKESVISGEYVTSLSSIGLDTSDEGDRKIMDYLGMKGDVYSDD